MSHTASWAVSSRCLTRSAPRLRPLTRVTTSCHTSSSSLRSWHSTATACRCLSSSSSHRCPSCTAPRCLRPSSVHLSLSRSFHSSIATPAPSAATASSSSSSSSPSQSFHPGPSSIPPPESHQLLFRQGILPSPDTIVNPTPRVREIFADLQALTQFEMLQLQNVLQKSYGVQVGMRSNWGLGAGGVMGGGGGGAAAQPTAAGAAASPVEAKEEKKAEEVVKSVFTVRLDGFAAADKIKVIKEVRTATGLGLKESKDLVEQAPKIIKKDISKADCDALVAKLKEAGAKVTVE